MKDFVDRLSANLSERYVYYLETLLVDLWSGSDHQRRLIVVMIFEEIEEKTDLAISEHRLDAN
ncbi:hypothetical protein [Devosia sp. UYZn731]|uniref:hypothetical protein n=1 Tax=Devosia sp. UYZn731 TaxID=3156345 RepID=UPI003392F09C